MERYEVDNNYAPHSRGDLERYEMGEGGTGVRWRCSSHGVGVGGLQ